MPDENFLTATAVRLAGIPFGIFTRRAFTPPKKAVILKPCCMSQVMLATPLLAALSDAFPKAQFDWAISDWARPAVATNPRLSSLINSGRVGLAGSSWRDARDLIQRLRQEKYDTCFIPSRSGLLSLIAHLAGIPQRIGLNMGGRGLANTIAVGPPPGERHEAALYLAISRALGIESQGGMEFFPPDSDRTAVTERLIDEVDWLGEVPLVLLHPGGGANPVWPDERKRWPVERFALLGNHMARKHKATILVVGAESDRPLAERVSGLTSVPVFNMAGRLTLGELGSLCEVADLYVGNDAGPTHIAAAVGCPTLAIFGPSDPAVSAPYVIGDRAIALRPQQATEPFSWEMGVTLNEAITAADTLLTIRQKGKNSL